MVENEQTENDKIDENELMKLLSEDQAKPKKWSLFKRNKRSTQTERVVEIKTIADIPPIRTVRTLASDNDLLKAAIQGREFAEKDIARSFGINFSPNVSTIYNIYTIFKGKDREISEDILVDREAFILQSSVIKSSNNQKDENMMGALRKLGLYIFDIYEKARFARVADFTPDELVKHLTDIYNYLDVKALYYPDERVKR